MLRENKGQAHGKWRILKRGRYLENRRRRTDWGWRVWDLVEGQRPGCRGRTLAVAGRLPPAQHADHQQFICKDRIS